MGLAHVLCDQPLLSSGQSSRRPLRPSKMMLFSQAGSGCCCCGCCWPLLLCWRLLPAVAAVVEGTTGPSVWPDPAGVGMHGNRMFFNNGRAMASAACMCCVQRRNCPAAARLLLQSSLTVTADNPILTHLPTRRTSCCMLTMKQR